MTDASIIYNVVVNYQLKNGEKAAKTQSAVNKESQKQGKIFTGLNKIFQQGAVRMFSLIFLFRRMRDSLVNMLKPAAQMTGIMDIWNMTLGMFFLPIMMTLLPYLLMFSDWLIGLPDWAKVVIGAIVLLGIAALTLGIIFIGASIAMAALGGGSVLGAIASLGKALLSLMFNPFVLFIAGVVLLLYWLWTVKEEMGGWENFFKNIIKGISRVFVLLGAIIVGVLSSAWNLVKQGWNSFIDFLEGGINSAIDKINVLIAAWNAIPFVKDIELIQQVSLSSAKADTTTAGNAFWNGFDSVLNPYLDWESKYLSTPSLEAVAEQREQDALSSKVDMYKANGMDNATIINTINGQRTGVQPQPVFNQTNNIEVADWTVYQKKMDEQWRRAQQEIDRKLAASQGN